MSKVEKLLALHEGKRLDVHLVRGIRHIGVGHNLEAKPLKWLGTRQTITEEECSRIFSQDLADACAALNRALPWWRGLDEVREAALIDLTFNMGIGRAPRDGQPGTGLLGFQRTLAMIEDGRYAGAATNLLLSKWATQVGTRATRIARMIETGQWPKEIA